MLFRQISITSSFIFQEVSCSYPQNFNINRTISGVSPSSPGEGGWPGAGNKSDSQSGFGSRTETEQLPPSSSVRLPINSPGCDQEGYFANPLYCSEYFQCVPGPEGLKREDKYCNLGEAWDTRLQTCNDISQVPDCGGPSLGPMPQQRPSNKSGKNRKNM